VRKEEEDGMGTGGEDRGEGWAVGGRRMG